MSPQVRPQRNLNRQQIQEILERNIALYREEEHFATYLVELALYLLEYEYDWAETSGPPAALTAGPAAVEPAPPAKATTLPPINLPNTSVRVSSLSGSMNNAMINSNKVEAPMVSVVPVGSRNSNQDLGERRIYSSTLQQPSRFVRHSAISKCPYCGVTVSDASLCPSCKHMIH